MCIRDSVFAYRGALMSQPFDAERLELRGAASQIARQVRHVGCLLYTSDAADAEDRVRSRGLGDVYKRQRLCLSRGVDVAAIRRRTAGTQGRRLADRPPGAARR